MLSNTRRAGPDASGAFSAKRSLLRGQAPGDGERIAGSLKSLRGVVRRHLAELGRNQCFRDYHLDRAQEVLIENGSSFEREYNVARFLKDGEVEVERFSKRVWNTAGLLAGVNND